MAELILVVNAGSSSIKFQVFATDGNGRLERRLRGAIDGIGSAPRLAVRGADGRTLADEKVARAEIPDLPAATQRLETWIRSNLAGQIPAAIGHRVVHGGPRFDRPVLVDDAVLAELERFVPLAPLHQPNNLAPIRQIRQRRPELPQVACFDTAFHRGHGELADRYALPEEMYQAGVRRYGFHGLSYEYIAMALPEVAPQIAHGRVVVAHLGSGASMAALRDGRSVDSTMGFTALDGLPMGTRPGQLDPGIVLYLQRKGMTADQIEWLLYHDCGLKGLSGISNDVRELQASADPRAAFALDYFVYRITRELGALAAALGGLDGLVFTAGIGENSAAIRAAVLKRAAWLGFAIDDGMNARNGPRITAPASKVPAYMIATDEELMMAQHTVAFVRPPVGV
jgi:acetate kinase